MKSKALWPILLLSLMLLVCPLGALAQEEAVTWQGHTLTVAEISTDFSEISAIYNTAPPAQGYMALLLLDVQDGTQITQEALDAYAEHFMLTDVEGNRARPLESVLSHQGHDLGLVFRLRSSEADAQALRLSVQALAEIPAAILDAQLDWQDWELHVIESKSDSAALLSSSWPEDGYMVSVRVGTKDESLIPLSRIKSFDYEIVLTDGQRDYAPTYTYYSTFPEGVNYFNMNYTIQGDAYPALDALALAVRPAHSLWLNAAARANATTSFAYFVPQAPEAYTVALALEDASKFAHDSTVASKEPEAALSSLESSLGKIRDDLQALLGDSVTFAEDPNQASAVIGIDIQYPSAGRYGPTGSVQAYDCTLLLTAYNAATHEAIAQLETGNHYGSSVSINQGTTTIWKAVPSIADADQAAQDTFVADLMAFWRK